MFKLSDDNIKAYESVQDTLDAAVSICVHILNEERKKEFSNNMIIDKYEEILRKASNLRDDIPFDNIPRMQEISDEYVQFVRKHRGL